LALFISVSRQMIADHQWSAYHRLRTAGVCVISIQTKGFPYLLEMQAVEVKRERTA